MTNTVLSMANKVLAVFLPFALDPNPSTLLKCYITLLLARKVHSLIRSLPPPEPNQLDPAIKVLKTRNQKPTLVTLLTSLIKTTDPNTVFPLSLYKLSFALRPHLPPHPEAVLCPSQANSPSHPPFFPCSSPSSSISCPCLIFHGLCPLGQINPLCAENMVLVCPRPPLYSGMSVLTPVSSGELVFYFAFHIDS